MGTYFIFYSSPVPLAFASIQVQEARLALLPFRSMLLRHRSKFHLHLAPATKPSSIRRVLFSITWIPRKRGHHMAE
jgi:hypothetical protein